MSGRGDWTDEDRKIFHKLRARKHWPIDNDSTDFYSAQVPMSAGQRCSDAARNSIAVDLYFDELDAAKGAK